MAPSKFVAPLKKSSGQNSFSSAFSSGSSFASASVGCKTTAADSVQPVQHGPSNPSRKTEQKKKQVTGNSVKGTNALPKQVKKSGDAKAAGSSKGVEASLKKKPQIASVAQSSSVVTKKAKDLDDDDIDKENVNPTTAKRMKLEKRPCLSLSDKDYESLFEAVLKNNQCDDSSKKAVGSNAKPDEPLNESKDLFEFSQSDLDDSEEEQAGIIKTTVAVNNGISQNSAKNSSPQIDAGDVNHKDMPTTPLQQVKDCTTSAHTEKVDDKPLTAELSSQESSVGDFKNLVTSTPQNEKPDLISSSYVTPQKKIPTPQPIAQSQEFNASPAASLIPKPSTTTVSGVTSALQQSGLVTPKSSLCATQGSRSSLNPNSPIDSPNRPLTLSQILKPSQEPRTPVCTPSRSSSVSQTAQSSRKPETPIRTPIEPSVSASNLGSPAPSTPIGSQHLSHLIEQTPPPPEKSAKERLLWLQKKRLAGLWVQCENGECKKWRYLEDTHDPTTLPDRWYCRMHPDEEFNNCEVPEKRLNLLAEEDMIFNTYSPGSLVWAKLSGYPWWPAMVEDDPDLEQFYWLNLFSDIPTWYHVVFFDDDKKSCCRAWVQVERLKNLEDQPFDNDSDEFAGYKKRVGAAYKKACSAQLLNIEDRLAQHSFATCYKGPIGGLMKGKYSGPIGHRKLISN